MNRIALCRYVLITGILMLIAGFSFWLRDASPSHTKLVNTSQSEGQGSPREKSEQLSGSVSAPDHSFSSGKPAKLTPDLSELNKADSRGELFGTFGTRTPEEILYDVTELRAEPFPSLVLQKLEEIFLKLKKHDDRIRAAALLHRYGRATGTEFLRDQLSHLRASAEAFPIAATLAMAQDQDSLQLLVDGMAQFASDPEFATAVAKWGHPALIEKARELIKLNNSPRGSLAWIIAMTGSQEVTGILKELASKTPPQNPFYFTYQAALARFGFVPTDELLASINKIAANPARVMAFLPETALLLGPEHIGSFLQGLVDSYTVRRLEYGTLYDAHALAVQNKTQGLRNLPIYPAMEQRRMLDALELLSEWKLQASAESVQNALIASQKGRYSVLLNRQIMSALVAIDPVNCVERLEATGFHQEEIYAAVQLRTLKPIAQSFLPSQRSIAITQPVKPFQ